MDPHVFHDQAKMRLTSKDQKCFVPVLTLQTCSALACLVGLAIPVEAQHLAWSPTPTSVQGLQEARKSETREKSKPALANADGKEAGKNDSTATTSSKSSDTSQRGKSEEKPPSPEGSTDTSFSERGNEKVLDKKTSSNKSTSTAHSIQQLPPRWFLYTILSTAVLLVLWLGLLTWFSYQGLAASTRKNERLFKEIMGIKDVLQNLNGSLSKQASSHAETKELADNIASKIQKYEGEISHLRNNLRYQDNRFLNFQSSLYGQAINYSGPAALATLKQPDHSSGSDQTEADHTQAANPGKVLATEYKDAFFRNDRAFLRRITTHELNITQFSEDSLMRSANLPTQLEVVKTGGSYLLIQRDGKNLLVPQFQNLTSFNTNPLAKGIFTYVKENISTAELREPAEVRESGGLWEIVSQGLIALPV